MRAVFVDVPQSLLDSRRASGADMFDEMWDGELHMVPPPSGDHQAIAAELFRALLPLADRAGLVARFETGLFRPGTDTDYRVPDQTFTRAEHLTARGIDGAALFIVEIRSPHDETDEKLPFYGEIGVGELLVIDPPTRYVELFTNRAGKMEPTLPVVVRALGVTAETVDSADRPRLRLTWDEGSAEI